MNSLALKSLPETDRPRERLYQLGGEALTSSELLAVLLGSGTKGKSVLHLSQEILSHFGSLRAISDASIEELCKIKGVGKAKAIQLKAALTLASRLSREGTEQRSSVTTPEHVYRLVKESIQNEKKEHLLVILLDARGKVIRYEKVSTGTLTQTLVHPREVFYPAIRHQAVSLILVHNHPSGDLEPSPEDIRITETLIQVGKLMGFPIHDHLIVSFKGYQSLRESHSLLFA